LRSSFQIAGYELLFMVNMETEIKGYNKKGDKKYFENN